MRRIPPFFIVSLLILMAACQEKKTPTEVPTSPPQSAANAQPSARKAPIDNSLYVWVDDLDIRQAPDGQSEIVASVQGGTPLTPQDETSENTDVVVLRGVCYDEPWVKITTPDGVEGWVFAGAVRRRGEDKGNAAMDNMHFKFPHFGKFNLEMWKKMDERSEMAGNAETLTQVFTDGSQVIEVIYANLGEYGSMNTLKLMDNDNNILKTRTLRIAAFVEENKAMTKLTETIKDYSSQPQKQFTRSQTVNKPASQLNAKPYMAKGDWVESNM